MAGAFVQMFNEEMAGKGIGATKKIYKRMNLLHKLDTGVELRKILTDGRRNLEYLLQTHKDSPHYIEMYDRYLRYREDMDIILHRYAAEGIIYIRNKDGNWKALSE